MAGYVSGIGSGHPGLSWTTSEPPTQCHNSDSHTSSHAKYTRHETDVHTKQRMDSNPTL